VTAQFNRLMTFVSSLGFVAGQPSDLRSQLLGGVGHLTSAVGSVIGAVASVLAMVVIGIFLASEPRLYDRGIAWMLPIGQRSGFYRIAEHVGFTLRRLLFGRLIAMIFEGVFTWFMLWIAGVPMAGLLGLLTGVLAFIPNIGAITSGLLMIAVGFSASSGQGVWCIIVYFLVHNIDAYVVVPFVARRTVDLAPAVLLAMQLLMAALFGILGVLFADPILATLKVVLVDLSHRQAREKNEEAGIVAPGPVTAGAAALPAAAVASAAGASAAGGARRRPGQSSRRAPQK
jgi:predicted PurR-regulated permease PerM